MIPNLGLGKMSEQVQDSTMFSCEGLVSSMLTRVDLWLTTIWTTYRTPQGEPFPQASETNPIRQDRHPQSSSCWM